MSEFNLTAIMNGIGTRLGSVSPKPRVYSYPIPSPSAPCVIVGYPTKIDFDMVFKRGADKAEFPIWFLVGRVDEQNARDNLSAILAGVGGIKDTLDGTLNGVVQSARCVDCIVETYVTGDVTYLSAKFLLEVYT